MKGITVTRLACAVFAVLSNATARPWHGQGGSENLDTLAGTRVIYSYPGLEPPTHLYDLIKQGKVGGVILFGENVGTNVGSVAQSFQDAYAQSPGYTGNPLLIMTDQEGRYIRRLPGGPYLSEKQIGESADPVSAANQAGQQAAAAILAANCNTNLAPVLGVYRQPDDFLDQWERSYSNNSQVVSECAPAFITAQQSAGAIATAKHFPGLGAASQAENTDEVPVTLDLSLEELRTVDMAPYSPAFAAGVDMVMTSWAIYPAVDPVYPSGLSQKMIQGELRGRLGFRGVTITDALEAGALINFGDAGQRGVQAARAGMDLLLASQRNVTQGEAIFEALVGAVMEGQLPWGQFREGAERVMAMRSKLVK